MEGIDDRRFRVLAFFDPLKNMRSVVQQVGRILRKEGARDPEVGYLLDHFGGRLGQFWQLYKKYDQTLDVEYLITTSTEYYLERFRNCHPNVDYFEGKFREPLDLMKVDYPADEILLTRSAWFRSALDVENIDALADGVEEVFRIQDCKYNTLRLSDDIVIFVYARIENPPFLNTKYFAEAQRHVCAIVRLPERDLIALHDSHAGGARLISLFDPSAVLPTKQFQGVITPGKGGRINSISSLSTNLGNRVVRRRTVGAPSIALLPPNLDEHGHVLRTFMGFNGSSVRIEDNLEFLIEFGGPGADDAPSPPDPSAEPDLIRRYVGMGSGRVSEAGPPLRIHKYVEWLKDIAGQMLSQEGDDRVFSRFTKPALSGPVNGAANGKMRLRPPRRRRLKSFAPAPLIQLPGNGLERERQAPPSAPRLKGPVKLKRPKERPVTPNWRRRQSATTPFRLNVLWPRKLNVNARYRLAARQRGTLGTPPEKRDRKRAGDSSKITPCGMLFLSSGSAPNSGPCRRAGAMSIIQDLAKCGECRRCEAARGLRSRWRNGPGMRSA